MLFSKISYNILQLQQVLMHEDTEAKKLMGVNEMYEARKFVHQIHLEICIGTLQALETSAVRSQSFNLERELPEFWQLVSRIPERFFGMCRKSHSHTGQRDDSIGVAYAHTDAYKAFCCH